jgi:ankyrin repeat protein
MNLLQYSNKYILSKNKKEVLKLVTIDSVIYNNLLQLKYNIYFIKEFSININKIHFNNIPLLHLSCIYGYYNITNELLKYKKININKKDNMGWTSIHYATINNDLELFQLLLSNGANYKIKTNKKIKDYPKSKNKNCYELSKIYNCSNILDYLDLPVAKVL